LFSSDICSINSLNVDMKINCLELIPFLGLVVGIASFLFTILKDRFPYRGKSLILEILYQSTTWEKPEYSDLPMVIQQAKLTGNSHIMQTSVARKFILFRIKNNGKLTITEKEFTHEPLKIVFGEIDKIVSVNIVKTHPDHLKPKINAENNRILLSPMLLNPGDFVTFAGILKYDSNIEVQSRLEGIPEVRITRNTNPIKTVSIFGALELIFLSLTLASIFLLPAPPLPKIVSIIFLGFFGVWYSIRNISKYILERYSFKESIENASNKLM
jgi:hypothetical protein